VDYGALEAELARAELLLDARRYPDAAEAAYRLTGVSPSDPRPLLIAARAEIAQGAAQRAEEVATRAVGLAPGSAIAHRLVALAQISQAYGSSITFQRQEMGRQAVWSAQEAVRLAPYEAASYWVLADACLVSSMTSEAIAATDQAVTLAPDLAQTWMVRSRVARVAGDLAAAEASAREALRLNPDHYQAGNELGIILRLRGRSAESLRQFADSAALDPLAAPARENLVRYGAVPFFLFTLLLLCPLAIWGPVVWLGATLAIQVVAWRWSPSKRFLERKSVAIALWRGRRGGLLGRRRNRQVSPTKPIKKRRPSPLLARPPAPPAPDRTRHGA
jgi:tetratricopeptide (TPR) repeat protein